MDARWSTEIFEADDGTVPFEAFIESLSDFKFSALDAAIRTVLMDRGIDLVRTEWLKPLGQGLHEFRVRHSAREVARMFDRPERGTSTHLEKVVLRQFVHFYGPKRVLLLGGYDKAKHPSPTRQQREIKRARRHLAAFKMRRG